ncbi:MAG: carboxy terminal-processing peptidase [Nitrospirota bacterium]
MMKRFFVVLLIGFLSLSSASAKGIESTGDHDYNRAQLVGYRLYQYLANHNFSNTKIDDGLSKKAFDLYIKQLDPQKRFLLKGDIEKLRAYADKIDDEVLSGKIELPERGAEILAERVAKTQQVVKELLAKDFDFTQDEFIETDIDKIDFCTTETELKDRWRKVLKYQVLSQYLNLLEDSTAETAAEKAPKESAKPEDLQKKAREKTLKSYEETFTRMQQEKRSEQFDRYFTALTRAFDPHTNYMPPTSKEDFDISMKGSLEGIGAVLREEDGVIKVESVKAGGPAARQGQLLAGDTIVKVAEGNSEPVDVTNMKLRDAVRLIRGKKGTEVKITVKRQGMPQFVIPIVRDVIQIDETFAKGTTIKDEKNGKTFGYIKLPSFYRDFDSFSHGKEGRNCTDDLKNELKKLESENISGLILDLRNNGGGALTDAINIAGLFIKEGPVVQVKSASGKVKVHYDEDPAVYYKGPLVVLVNKFSASASEILAGALQDYGRAVIMGSDHTHGKGTVQIVFDLSEGLPFSFGEQYKPLGALMLTTQKFYRVSGGSTQYRGVEPDIVLPDPLKSLKTGEQYLDYALPWDTVAPVQYTKWQPALPDLAQLKARSSARVQGNQEFTDMVKESVRIGELQAKTLQPLHIDAVRKEREEALKHKGKEAKARSPHGASESKKTDTSLSEEERKQQWVLEVSKDPYVQEAMGVLLDMVSPTAVVSVR